MDNQTNNRNLTINISTLTIIKVVLVFLLLVFLYIIQDILIVLFGAIIFSATISPWIDTFQRKGVPRFMGLIVIYLIFFTILSLAIGLLIPPIVTEINQIAKELPFYYQKISSFFVTWQETPAPVEDIQKILISLGVDLSRAAQANIFDIFRGAFGGFFSFILLLVLIFYMTLKEQTILKFFQQILPVRFHAQVFSLITRIQRKIGFWLKGQLFLCLIIGFLSFIGLFILGVNYALILALIAGITEIVPFIGPIIGAIPAVLLAFIQSPIKAVFVIILYIIIQQLENQIIVPRVMKKALGLNPIIVILVILIGGRLAGILGALVALPAATAASVFVKDYLEMKEKKKEEMIIESKNNSNL